MIFLRGYIYDGKKIKICEYKRSIYDILNDITFYIEKIDKKWLMSSKDKEATKYNLLNRNYISYIESFNIYMERKGYHLKGNGHLTKEGILENIQTLHKIVNKDEEKTKLEIMNEMEANLGRELTENKLLYELLKLFVRYMGKVKVR